MFPQSFRIALFFGLSGSGRVLVKVFRSPATSAISPTRKRARSIEWAAMSPSAPEPAFFLSSRQTSGNFGSVIQSWR